MSIICVRAVFSCAVVLNSLIFLILSSPFSDPHDLVSIATNQMLWQYYHSFLLILVFSFYFIKVLDYRFCFFVYRSRGYHQVRTNCVINIDDHKLSLVMETFAACFAQLSTSIYWNHRT